MNYIIPIVVVLLVFVVVIFVYRKKHHTEISRLDQKRLDIQNKPVLEELSKVKSLNMSGQAEEMFERWRNKWSELIDVELPKIDEHLMQVEDFVDKFQFKKATALEKEIELIIDSCDEELVGILGELNELMESEQQSRVEIEKLQLDYRTARKTLLAHQYSFGAAGVPLEKELEIFPAQFEEYNRLTIEGNYLEARNIVEELDKKGERIFRLIGEIPTLLTEIQHKIPSDIKDIRNGHREMELQSFFLLHLEIPEKLEAIEAKLPIFKEHVIHLETENIKEQMAEIKSEIDTFYDALENEAHAKRFVDTSFAEVGQQLAEVSDFVDDLQDESDTVQKSYHLSESEVAVPVQARSAISGYRQRYELLAVEVKEKQSAYSSLREELEELHKLIEEQRIVAEAYFKKLVNLRVHENDGRDQLAQLEKRLHQLERKIQKANIPGVPEEIDARCAEIEKQLNVIKKELNQIPINVGVIATGVNKGDSLITEAEQVVTEMMENVQLIELLIQYGNRYRTVKPGMDERLIEAEEAFRNLRFNKALEIVATAVDTAEPGALKKMEEIARDKVVR
ncbi:MAG: hypothetical protein KBT36_10140 [Kurthia sp.]|nr:hypothetical protein [Candidatus Kurthia equi]